MPTNDDEIRTIAAAIERYVSEHPQAADTTEGIRRWWGEPRGCPEPAAAVQRAIEYLIERKRLRAIELLDGTVIYTSAARAE